MGYDTVTKRERPRSVVSALENRVAQLEIELTHAKADRPIDQSEAARSAIERLTYRLATSIGESLQGPPLSKGLTLSAASKSSFLSLSSTIYLSQSPLPTLHIRDVDLSSDTKSLRRPTRCSSIASIPRHVVDLMLKNYTDVYLAQYPNIEEAQLYKSCEKVYTHDREQKASHFDFFSVAIALAISVSRVAFGLR